MKNKQKITDTSCPSCWENNNKILEVLEEFDSIFITNEKFDNLINMGDSPDVYEPSGEMYPKKIKSYLKQKLQEVEQRKVEEIIEKLGFNNKDVDLTSYGWIIEELKSLTKE